MLEIIYQDEHLIAINKPHGLLVHRSKIANDATEFALQLLRDQIGQHVNPVHRLDRKTSGLLLFAFTKEVEIAMQKQFQESLVEKKYLAILRGYAPDRLDIDYPLKKRTAHCRKHLLLLLLCNEQKSKFLLANTQLHVIL